MDELSRVSLLPRQIVDHDVVGDWRSMPLNFSLRHAVYSKVQLRLGNGCPAFVGRPLTLLTTYVGVETLLGKHERAVFRRGGARH